MKSVAAALVATLALLASRPAEAKGPQLGDAVYQLEALPDHVEPGQELSLVAHLDRGAACDRASDFLARDLCLQYMDLAALELTFDIPDSDLDWLARSFTVPMSECGVDKLCGIAGTEGLAEGAYRVHQFTSIEPDPRLADDAIYNEGVLIGVPPAGERDPTPGPGDKEHSPDDSEPIPGDSELVGCSAAVSASAGPWTLALIALLCLALGRPRRRES